MATEPRGLGSGKKNRLGDSSGLSIPGLIEVQSSLDHILSRGGTTCNQPGDELQSQNCVAPGRRLPNLALRSAPEGEIAQCTDLQQPRISTRKPPADKLPVANSCHGSKRPKPSAGSKASPQLAKRSCVHPKKLDWHPPVEREDRLASSSRSRRHRIMRKRPPNADEGISAKRLKLDTG